MSQEAVQNNDVANDAILSKAKMAMMTAYGVGAKALPWAAIIAALMQVLSQCTKPTPAMVRAQLQRFGVHVRLARRFRELGLDGRESEKAITACVESVDASTDEDIVALANAAEETA